LSDEDELPRQSTSALADSVQRKLKVEKSPKKSRGRDSKRRSESPEYAYEKWPEFNDEAKLDFGELFAVTDTITPENVKFSGVKLQRFIGRPVLETREVLMTVLAKKRRIKVNFTFNLVHLYL
jgi:hypothetical protein